MGYNGFVMIFYIIACVLSTLLSFGIVACQFVGNWFVFKKMNMPGWKGIIPYYNTYLLFEKVWDVKHFWTYIGLIILSFVVMIFAYFIFFVGAVLCAFTWLFELDVHGYGNTYITAIVLIVVYIIALVIALAAIGAVIAAIVLVFKLNNRLAHAFGKGAGFAAGLTFLSPIFTIILGFDKSVYLGRRM